VQSLTQAAPSAFKSQSLHNAKGRWFGGGYGAASAAKADCSSRFAPSRHCCAATSSVASVAGHK